jgi:hypothetical protein
VSTRSDRLQNYLSLSRFPAYNFVQRLYSIPSLSIMILIMLSVYHLARGIVKVSRCPVFRLYLQRQRNKKHSRNWFLPRPVKISARHKIAEFVDETPDAVACARHKRRYRAGRGRFSSGFLPCRFERLNR